MTANRASLILFSIAMIVVGVGFTVLHLLGVGDEGVVLFTALCIFVFCGLVGFIPERYPRR